MHKCHNAHVYIQCAYDFKFMYPYQSGGSWILPFSASRALFARAVWICLYGRDWMCVYGCVCVCVLYAHVLGPFSAYGWLLFVLKWFWTFDLIRQYMGNCVCSFFFFLFLLFVYANRETYPPRCDDKMSRKLHRIFLSLAILKFCKWKSHVLALNLNLKFVNLNFQLDGDGILDRFESSWACERSGFPVQMRESIAGNQVKCIRFYWAKKPQLLRFGSI